MALARGDYTATLFQKIAFDNARCFALVEQVAERRFVGNTAALYTGLRSNQLDCSTSTLGVAPLGCVGDLGWTGLPTDYRIDM